MTKTIPVSAITLHPDLYYREPSGIDVLAESMAKPHGLLHPLTVNKQHQLIIGRRRLEAARHLQWENVEARVIDMANPFDAIRDENDCREDFTISEKVALGKAIEAYEAERAKERMLSGKAQSDESEPSGNLPQGRAKDKAADAVGMSRHTYEKASEVVDAAAADPDLEAVVQEMDATGKVAPAHRKVKAATILCDSCQTRQRKGQPLKERCQECKKWRNAAKAEKNGGGNQDGDHVPDAKAPPPMDDLGNDIPKKLRDTFAGNRETLNSIIKLLQEAKRMGKGLASWNPFIREFDLEKQIGDTVKDVKNGLPYSVCHLCEGKGCEPCRKHGWLTKWKHLELEAKS